MNRYRVTFQDRDYQHSRISYTVEANSPYDAAVFALGERAAAASGQLIWSCWTGDHFHVVEIVQLADEIPIYKSI